MYPSPTRERRRPRRSPHPEPGCAVCGQETSDTLGCPIDSVLHDMDTEDVLGIYHEPFLDASQDLFALELVNL
jgi:hypothetical protein